MSTHVYSVFKYVYHCCKYCRFGPLRHHWCMRFESKNAQMKGFVTNCFKNVPLSVAIRHQQWLCYNLAVRPGQYTSGFIYPGDEIISGI